MDVNDSQHGDVDCFCIASSSSSGDTLLATRCRRMCLLTWLFGASWASCASSRGALLARQACLWFFVYHKFSDGYTRWNFNGCITRLFFLLADLYGEWYLVHSFAFKRNKGKSFLFLFRETAFDMLRACHGASCASGFGSIKSPFSICHPERSEGSRIHKRGCSRDSSSLRSSEWQECLRWH